MANSTKQMIAVVEIGTEELPVYEWQFEQWGRYNPMGQLNFVTDDGPREYIGSFRIDREVNGLPVYRMLHFMPSYYVVSDPAWHQ